MMGSTQDNGLGYLPLHGSPKRRHAATIRDRHEFASTGVEPRTRSLSEVNR